MNEKFKIEVHFILITGLIVVNQMEKLAYSEKKIEKNPWLLDDDSSKAEVKVSKA